MKDEPEVYEQPAAEELDWELISRLLNIVEDASLHPKLRAIHDEAEYALSLVNEGLKEAQAHRAEAKLKWDQDQAAAKAERKLESAASAAKEEASSSPAPSPAKLSQAEIDELRRRHAERAGAAATERRA